MMIDVLIIGAGLSGLHSAYLLNQLGLSFAVVEARETLGGRVVSINADAKGHDSSKPAFDLGPSWFWSSQPLMQNLVSELNLSDDVFLQYAQGAGLYQRADHQVFKGINGISMAGSYRLSGGIHSIIKRLSQHLPPKTIHLNSTVSQIRTIAENKPIETTVINDNQSSIFKSRFIISAIPPRLLIQNIKFSPRLTQAIQQQLMELPTWMANQAKVVIQYPKAFWKDFGLSGDVFSDLGPLREIHDASINDHNALCGFIGWPAKQRIDKQALKKSITEQLTALFGDHAQHPDRIMINDWAQEPFTASEKDLQNKNPQHGVGLTDDERELIKNVFCSGAEAASNGGRNNGYLEGALEASTKSVEKIKQAL